LSIGRRLFLGLVLFLGLFYQHDLLGLRWIILKRFVPWFSLIISLELIELSMNEGFVFWEQLYKITFPDWLFTILTVWNFKGSAEVE